MGTTRAPIERKMDAAAGRVLNRCATVQRLSLQMEGS